MDGASEAGKATGALTAAPHSLQNFAADALTTPHCGQTRDNPVPHSEQNFPPAGFSNAQLVQRIESLCD